MTDFLAYFVDTYGTQLAILAETTAALVLAGLIGLERELSDKPAGVRTHMLVGAAASLLVGLSEVMTESVSVGAAETVRADPIRVIEAIATAVAVLGAGTILRPDGDARVEGLTTAASLFFAAGIGIACALDQYVVAAAATLLVLLTLRVVGWLEHRSTRGGSDP